MNAFRLTLVGEGKGPHMFDIFLGCLGQGRDIGSYEARRRGT